MSDANEHQLPGGVHLYTRTPQVMAVVLRCRMSHIVGMRMSSAAQVPQTSEQAG